MSLILSTSELFAEQAQLDEKIHQKHHLNYPQTCRRRQLAFLVELDELANATRCFKYWSNKPAESAERIADEYADGLHFLLAMGLASGITPESFRSNNQVDSLPETFLLTHQMANQFFEQGSSEYYQLLASAFMRLGELLGLSETDIKEAYHKKNLVNIQRQEDNY